MAYPHEKCYPGGSKGLTLAGYVLLLGLMVFFTFKDVLRIFQ